MRLGMGMKMELIMFKLFIFWLNIPLHVLANRLLPIWDIILGIQFLHQNKCYKGISKAFSPSSHRITILRKAGFLVTIPLRHDLASSSTLYHGTRTGGEMEGVEVLVPRRVWGGRRREACVGEGRILHSSFIPSPFFVHSLSLPSPFPPPFTYINDADAMQTTIAVIDNVLDHLSFAPGPSKISYQAGGTIGRMEPRMGAYKGVTPLRGFCRTYVPFTTRIRARVDICMVCVCEAPWETIRPPLSASPDPYLFETPPTKEAYIAAEPWPGFVKPIFDPYWTPINATDPDADSDSETTFQPPPEETCMRLSRVFNPSLPLALDVLYPHLQNATNCAKANEPSPNLLDNPPTTPKTMVPLPQERRVCHPPPTTIRIHHHSVLPPIYQASKIRSEDIRQRTGREEEMETTHIRSPDKNERRADKGHSLPPRPNFVHARQNARYTWCSPQGERR
ncbi:uncharacterized protein LACBIDRAFT_332701 [Laccaria bicolor S238N-H82]|uniref:Predicted protein n=1 Tax=Laccaria bicolor (strain S238N-H82 / ATCC MYA-4686) TaxID=486041 RepID=B0DTL2_LACBS|nr:uncharacterized protein LACBIDRAFT_332701 [Laccaria bicolor S238N-H82]EDR02136.1 predicted protein [Laccaria bicolor S238N-H82]|eukprot:XP_001887293.1 predicted protein [Laccaria bicolor S238N-H82]